MVLQTVLYLFIPRSKSSLLVVNVLVLNETETLHVTLSKYSVKNVKYAFNITNNLLNKLSAAVITYGNYYIIPIAFIGATKSRKLELQIYFVLLPYIDETFRKLCTDMPI